MATRRRQPEPSGARHEQIAEYLRKVVAAASPGDRLPSDAELCARFGVSRMTARQAVQTLANERLLYRQRGRGTFVAARQIPRVLGSPLSFTGIDPPPGDGPCLGGARLGPPARHGGRGRGARAGSRKTWW